MAELGSRRRPRRRVRGVASKHGNDGDPGQVKAAADRGMVQGLAWFWCLRHRGLGPCGGKAVGQRRY